VGIDAGLLLNFLPEILLLAGALGIFLLDALELRRLEAFGAVAVVAIAGALALLLADLGWLPLAALRTVGAGAVDAPAGPGTLYAFTSLGFVFQAIFLLAALLVALAALSRPSRSPGAAVFFGLLLLATLGMLLVAVATELIFLLLALEVTAIASYLLVGYTRRDPRGLEAAMKFYIIGALSAALAFFGASLLYGAYGSTSLLVLGHALPGGGHAPLAIAGYAFLLVGLGFEVTAVPFHMWAVDVYDGAPHEVSAFLAGGTKKAGIFALVLLVVGPVLFVASPPGGPTASFHASLQLTLALLAVATMTVGNVLALMQREMKRLLAYSSISQAGYMLLGLAVGTAPGLAGATFQVFAHVFLKAGAFLVVAAAAGLGIGPLVEAWAGLGVRRPVLGAAFALMLLGLAGIPLTIGFFSKFVLFSAAVEAQGLFVWLAVAGLLNSALSVFYYGRVLKVMYLDRAEGPEPAAPSGPDALALGGIGWGRAAALGLAVVAIVALGIDPNPVLVAIQQGASRFLTLGV
jgi:F420H2 dehydrogenase subunit N